jgi:two-component system chemotaxis response regulator CheB
MRRIRVLVVDDSVVVRRIVRDVLTEVAGLEVVGVAANGRIALNLVEQFAPDIVTLDIEMPEMDGLEVLRHLQQSHPKLPVIMFSTLTQRGAIATLDALALGARDYVTKPANVGSVGASLERIRNELVPKIKALCGSTTEVARQGVSKAAPLALSGVRSASGEPIDMVAIGTSTGGPNALVKMLPELPSDFPVPVVVVQHMPPTFTRFLAERLSANCPLPVREAESEQLLEPGTIWIAPGDYHVVVERDGTRDYLRSSRTPPENFCRPSVDVLFRSVARLYRSRALGVIMTGMGQDGLRGSEQLRDVGATIFAQDEASSVVWGMPGFVVQAGLADKVVPLPQLGGEIVRRVQARGQPHWREGRSHVHQPC